MRRMIVFAFATAVSAAAALAQGTGAPPNTAAGKQALGTIASVDAVAGTVTLASGETYKLPAEIKSTELKVGTRVRIEFELDPMGLMVAKAIAAIAERPDDPSPTAKPTEGGAG